MAATQSCTGYWLLLHLLLPLERCSLGLHALGLECVLPTWQAQGVCKLTIPAARLWTSLNISQQSVHDAAAGLRALHPRSSCTNDFSEYDETEAYADLTLK